MFLWTYNFRRSTSGSPLHKTHQDDRPLFPYTFTAPHQVITSHKLLCNCKTICTHLPDVTRSRFVMTPIHSIKVVGDWGAGGGGDCTSLHAYIDNDTIWTAPPCRYELPIHILLSPRMASHSVPIRNSVHSAATSQTHSEYQCIAVDMQRRGTVSAVSGITETGQYGINNARYCRYSDMSSWWWVELPLETCRAVYKYISKLCIVASCWIIIEKYVHNM
jgi:hypothetical protein